jgi:transcriptional regulator with XRE-family HTH domain
MQALFGTELRRMREVRRLRLSDVANTSGLHVSYLSRIETNERPAPSDSLRASIYRALSLSKEEELLLEKAAKHAVKNMPIPEGFGVAIILPKTDLVRYLKRAGLSIQAAGFCLEGGIEM